MPFIFSVITFGIPPAMRYFHFNTAIIYLLVKNHRLIFLLLLCICFEIRRTNWQSVPVQQQNIIFELGQAFATLGIVSFGIWMTSMLGS